MDIGLNFFKISSDYLDKNPIDTSGFNLKDRVLSDLIHPTLLDVGPGKVHIQTAIDDIKNYIANHIDPNDPSALLSDPLAWVSIL